MFQQLFIFHHKRVVVFRNNYEHGSAKQVVNACSQSMSYCRNNLVGGAVATKNNALLENQIEFLDAQARAARYQTRQSGQTLSLENPLIGEIRSRYTKGEILQPHETAYLISFIEFTIINWEYLWSEYNAGLLDIAELAVDGLRDSWNAIPNELQERWLQLYARFYDPDFIEWMETNIINP